MALRLTSNLAAPGFVFATILASRGPALAQSLKCVAQLAGLPGLRWVPGHVRIG